MTYQELLDAVRANPVDADYHALRMAYVHQTSIGLTPMTARR